MHSNINKRFGRFIKALRIIRHVKRRDLAEYLCLDKSKILDIERGKFECPVESLVPLSKMFQISINDLLIMRISQPENPQPS